MTWLVPELRKNLLAKVEVEEKSLKNAFPPICGANKASNKTQMQL